MGGAYMREFAALIAILLVGVTPTPWATDDVPAPELDFTGMTRCEAVEAEAMEVMKAMQFGDPMPNSPLVEDAERYPLYAYYADKIRIVQAFSNKHHKLCRLEEHGITSYEP